VAGLFRVDPAWQSLNRQEVEKFVIHLMFLLMVIFIRGQELDCHGVGYSAASWHGMQMKIHSESEDAALAKTLAVNHGLEVIGPGQ
jgi:hypothetical protein